MGLRGRELTVRREKAAQPAGFLVGDDAVPQDHAAQDLEQEAVESRVAPVCRALEVHQESRLFAIDRAVREDRPLQQVGLALVEAAIVQQEFFDKGRPVHRTPPFTSSTEARARPAKASGRAGCWSGATQRSRAAAPDALASASCPVSAWEAGEAACGRLAEPAAR